MRDVAEYRLRFQDQIESSIVDILFIVRCGAFSQQEAAIAQSVEKNFFKLDRQSRLLASLDPRIVFSVEEIQRLTATYGASALERPDLKALAQFVLRLDLYTMLSGRSTGRFVLDCHAGGNFSIPGTSIYLRPKEVAHEIMVVDGVIESCFGGILASGDFSKGIDRLGVAHFEDVLRPPIQGMETLSLSSEERIEWERAVGSAVELIRYHAGSAELVSEFGWLLVPIRNERAGYHSSVSFSSLPNAIFASFHGGAESFAEALVHESDHNLLYLISRYEDFWQKPAHLQSAIYRSPWRDDPRPLDGILRGASAFVQVGSLWAALLMALPKTHSSLNWIRKRVFLCNLQAVDALRTLTNVDELSTFGRQQVEAWRDSAEDTHRAIMRESAAQAYLLAAFDEQARHDNEWAQRNPTCVAHSRPMSLDEYLSFV
jgi:hypothetical protein